MTAETAERAGMEGAAASAATRGRRWVTALADEKCGRSVADELGLPWVIGRALVTRGISSAEAARSYFSPRLSRLSDPFELPGMEQAVERIWRALRGNERIVVFGDYDADGVTGTALMVQVLRRLGGTVGHFLPNRVQDGFGLRVEPLQRCLGEHRPQLLITVDCGTGAKDAFSIAAAAGCDVVVTDHHEPGEGGADPVTVVNPKLDPLRRGETLAGVGVAFKLGHALIKHGLERGFDGVRSVDMRDWLDLVAVGTVADVVPLTDENRIFVTHGLARLARTASEGLGALLRVSRLDGPLQAYHVGFVLGPRINAAGRFGDARPALDLLLASNRLDAERLALVLDKANSDRKKIEDQIMKQAVTEIDATYDGQRDFGVAAGREGWHSGVIGVVASRLSGKYRRPAMMVGFSGAGPGRGSCRSIESVDILQILHGCSDLLVSYGGHCMAAGLTVERRNMDELKERFNSLCRERLAGEDLRPVCQIDAWMDSLGEVDERLVEAVRRFAPFGNGNPAPTWGIRGVRVLGEPRVVGKEHLRFTVAGGGTQIEAIAFGMANRKIAGEKIDVAFHAHEDEYMGRRRIQLKVKDFRPSED